MVSRFLVPTLLVGLVLSACAPAEHEEACVPSTCQAQSATCGQVPDGCGGMLTCGSCGNGETCGTDHRCAPAGCVPKTCEQLGKDCGSLSDGCGGTLSCGTCPEGKHCGGGGSANTCGAEPCVPESDRAFCERLGKNCGSVIDFDNCDASRTVASCGSCQGAQTCGGGGQQGVCGCTGETDAELCGKAGDACGSATLLDRCGVSRTVSCGTCREGEACDANRCECVPETDAALCASAGASCGAISVTDHCGNGRTPDCGACGGGDDCREHRCVCVAETDAQFCSRLAKNCGSVTGNDNCHASRTVDCGNCGGTCTNNVCVCSESREEFCQRLGTGCGPVTAPDKCGVTRTEDCGSCAGELTCGGSGIAGQCGGFVSVASGTTGAIADLWGSSENDLWAVGSDVRHWDGQSWGPPPGNFPSLSFPYFAGVAGRSAQDVWIVGTARVHWDGTTWHAAPDPSGYNDTFYAITATWTGYFALSSRGTFVTSDSSPLSWGWIAGDNSKRWGLGSNGSYPYACGNKVTSTWSDYSGKWIDTTVSAQLMNIWGSGSQRWAVGANGAIVEIGTSTRVLPPQVSVTLRDVHGTGPNDVWAVGDAGTVMHSDGTSWTVLPPVSVNGGLPQLDSVWVTPHAVWVGTSAGGILRLSR